MQYELLAAVLALGASVAANIKQYILARRHKEALQASRPREAITELNDKFPAIVGPFEEYVDEYDDWFRRLRTGTSATPEQLRSLIDHAHKRQRPPELARIEERNGNIQQYYDNMVRQQVKKERGL